MAGSDRTTAAHITPNGFFHMLMQFSLFAELEFAPKTEPRLNSSCCKVGSKETPVANVKRGSEAIAIQATDVSLLHLVTETYAEKR
jgi:hypothetical protein